MKWQSKGEQRIFWVVVGGFMLFLVVLLVILVYRLENGVEAEIPYSGGRIDGMELDTETVVWEDGLYGVGAEKEVLWGNNEEDEPVLYLAPDIIRERNGETDFSRYGNYFLRLADALEAEDYEYLYSCLSHSALDRLHTSYTVETLRGWLEGQRKLAGEDTILVYHETLDCGEYVKCLASFVGYSGGSGNILYDYKSAVDMTFSVYEEDGEYRFLPFDVSEYGVVSMFGTGKQKFYQEYLEALSGENVSDPVVAEDGVGGE